MSRLTTPRSGTRRAAPVMLARPLEAAALATADCAGVGQATPARPGGQAGAVGTAWFAAGHRPAVPEVPGTTLTGAHLWRQLTPTRTALPPRLLPG